MENSTPKHNDKLDDLKNLKLKIVPFGVHQVKAAYDRKRLEKKTDKKLLPDETSSYECSSSAVRMGQTEDPNIGERN